jgi:hypothetical protein
MIRKGWSYKEDRRLSKLAGSGKTLEQIAKAMHRTPDGIRNRSIRLGISIKSGSRVRRVREKASLEAEKAQEGAMTVWIYVNTCREVGTKDHVKVFATTDAAEKWFEENDPEGVAFEYEVLD